MECYISNNAQQTFEIAYNLAKNTKWGTNIELVGEMGVGKTVFAKGFAKGLGIDAPITSPTFALLNKYINNEGHILYHFDLYRLESIEELYLLGFEDIFYDANAISLIEWPQIAQDLLPKKRIRIEIDKSDDNTRNIKVEQL